MAQLIIFIAFGIALSRAASKRGYSPVAWFCAAGLIGYVVLLMLPDLNKGDFPEDEKASRVSTGNLIGVGLSIFAFALGFWLTRIR